MTSGMRELTEAELDMVSGGITFYVNPPGGTPTIHTDIPSAAGTGLSTAMFATLKQNFPPVISVS